MIGAALRNGAVLLVSGLCMLGVSELVLALSGRFPTHNLHSVSLADYERIPGLWEPGQDFVNLQHPKLPHRIHTNALGLRGAETSRAPRGPRVLCIGDSFTFGDFVDDEQTLPAQLAGRLGARVEVLNGGVGGTTVVDQRVFLERMLVLEPDVVLLTFSENDLTDLRARPPIHEQLAANRKLKSGAFAPVYAVARDTALFHLLLRARGVYRNWQKDAKDREERAGSEPGEISQTLVARYVRSVTDMRDALALRGVGFVFAAYPSHLTVSGESQRDKIAPVLAGLAAKGIEGVDLTASLRAAGRRMDELYLLPHDGHPSAAGYGVVAPLVAERVRRELEGTRHAQRAPAGEEA